MYQQGDLVFLSVLQKDGWINVGIGLDTASNTWWAVWVAPDRSMFATANSPTVCRNPTPNTPMCILLPCSSDPLWVWAENELNTHHYPGMQPSVMTNWTSDTWKEEFPEAVTPKPPKNNDGRAECFWCQGPTKTITLFLHNSQAQVCTKCGK